MRIPAVSWPVASSAAGPGATPLAPSAASELGQLGAGCRDAHSLRTEVDDQGGVILNAHDPAEAVPVVSHLVLHGELLGRRGGGRGLEGACGQVAPGRGVGRLHHFQYAPRPQPLIPPVRARLRTGPSAAAHDRNLLIPLILGVVMPILGMLLRAVVAPLVLIATVMLSIRRGPGACPRWPFGTGLERHWNGRWR